VSACTPQARSHPAPLAMGDAQVGNATPQHQQLPRLAQATSDPPWYQLREGYPFCTWCNRFAEEEHLRCKTHLRNQLWYGGEETAVAPDPVPPAASSVEEAPVPPVTAVAAQLDPVAQAHHRQRRLQVDVVPDGESHIFAIDGGTVDQLRLAISKRISHPVKALFLNVDGVRQGILHGSDMVAHVTTDEKCLEAELTGSGRLMPRARTPTPSPAPRRGRALWRHGLGESEAQLPPHNPQSLTRGDSSSHSRSPRRGAITHKRPVGTLEHHPPTPHRSDISCSLSGTPKHGAITHVQQVGTLAHRSQALPRGDRNSHPATPRHGAIAHLRPVATLTRQPRVSSNHSATPRHGDMLYEREAGTLAHHFQGLARGDRSSRPALPRRSAMTHMRPFGAPAHRYQALPRGDSSSSSRPALPRRGAMVRMRPVGAPVHHYQALPKGDSRSSRPALPTHSAMVGKRRRSPAKDPPPKSPPPKGPPPKDLPPKDLPPKTAARTTTTVHDEDAPQASVHVSPGRPSGTPADWNDPARAMHTGKAAMKALGRPQAIEDPDINKLLKWLGGRPIPYTNDAVTRVLGAPERMPDQEGAKAWRLPLQAIPEGVAQAMLEAGWRRAWHGSKPEALWSILADGELRASADPARGEQLLAGVRGVYSFHDGLKNKALGYARWTPIPSCGEWVLWSTVFELLVEERFRITPPVRTDQWIHPMRGVRLLALWVRGLRIELAPGGLWFKPHWVPEEEAAPREHRLFEQMPSSVQPGQATARATTTVADQDAPQNLVRTMKNSGGRSLHHGGRRGCPALVRHYQDLPRGARSSRSASLDSARAIQQQPFRHLWVWRHP